MVNRQQLKNYKVGNKYSNLSAKLIQECCCFFLGGGEGERGGDFCFVYVCLGFFFISLSLYERTHRQHGVYLQRSSATDGLPGVA